MNGSTPAAASHDKAAALPSSSRRRIGEGGGSFSRPKKSHVWRASSIVKSLLVVVVLLPSACAAAAVAAAPRPKKTVARNASVSTTVKKSSAASNNSRSSPNSGGGGAWRNGLKSGAASASAAACVKTLLQPIDAVKTVQQFHEGTAALPLGAACRQLAARPGGVLNFYAGLGVTVIGALPGVALYFGVYSYCKERLLRRPVWRDHPAMAVAASAALGNTVASFSRVPYEVLKQQLQAGLHDSTGAALRELAARPAGAALGLLFPRGGVWGQMLRDVPYAVVTLLVYESLQGYFQSGADNGNPARARGLNFLLGGTAGGVGSWVTTPMDVVKTRLQTAKGGGTVAEVARQVWREGGAPAFLRGAVPRLLHKVPANALFFYFYEFFKVLYRVEAPAAAAAAPTQAAEAKKK